MELLLVKIISAILSGVTSSMDLLGNSVLGVLSMNIGSGTSIFDIVLGSIQDFYQIFIKIALVLLFMNYIWQLGKIMVSPNGTGETPIALTFRTLVAGILIYWGKELVIILQQVFNEFYKLLLTTKIDGVTTTVSMDFTGLSNDISDATENAATETGVVRGGFTALVMTCSLMWLIIKEYWHYMIECVERYVVLGVLIYTTPLAMSTAGSKSTSNIFGSWIRMVMSQMILMLFNVVFLRLFVTGFTQYKATIVTLQSVPAYESISALALSVVWCLVMYAILYVGTKVDTYLSALGLSVAQTGRGMVSTIVSDGFSARNMFAAGKRAVGTVTNVGGYAAYNHIKRNEKTKYDSNGVMTKESLGKMVDGKVSDRVAKQSQGKGLGLSVMQNSNIPSDLKNTLNPNSARFDNKNGSISIDTMPDKNGKVSTMTLSKATDNQIGQVQGRAVDIAGQKYLATFSGANSKELLNSNPELTKSLDKWESSGANREVNAVKDKYGNETGCYNLVEKDHDGNIVSAMQISPQTMYAPDSDVPTRMAEKGEFGSIGYNVADITAMAKREDGIVPVPKGASNVRTSDAINTNFTRWMSDHNMKAQDSASYGEGILSTSCPSLGKDASYVFAPASKYNVSETYAKGATTFYTENGASYIAVPVHCGGNKTNPTENQVQAIFEKRTDAGDVNTTVYAKAKDTPEQFIQQKEMYEEQHPIKTSASKIWNNTTSHVDNTVNNIWDYNDAVKNFKNKWRR